MNKTQFQIGSNLKTTNSRLTSSGLNSIEKQLILYLMWTDLNSNV